MVGFFARLSFWKEKKNLNNQNTEKRKEQRATLLQVITIYYRNSSAAQLFWLQPWWAERGRKAVKRGHLLCFVSWRTKTQVTLGNDVPLSRLWVFCDHLKYQLSQTHFPLQSVSSLIMSLSNHLSPVFFALQPTSSKQIPPSMTFFFFFSFLPKNYRSGSLWAQRTVHFMGKTSQISHLLGVGGSCQIT